MTGAEADVALGGTPVRWDLWAGRIALGLVLAPLVVSAVYLTVGVGTDYYPAGDLALTELVVRDVGRRPVLVGPYSRDGWHHPGPVSSYLYAVPYRLLGSTPTALGVAALAVNGAAISGMAHLARRRGGLPLVLVTLLGCSLLLRALPPDNVRLVWNPHITVLPFGALVFVTWSLACRDRWALPVAVAVASFLAQTHVAYVALTAPLLVLGVASLVWSTVRQSDAGDPLGARLRPLVAPFAVAGAVGLALWAAPVYEQLTRDPGNLTEIVRWFEHGGTSGGEARGWRAGWRLVSAQYAVTPEWIVGPAPVSPYTAESTYLYEPRLPVGLVAVAAALVVLVRRRSPGARSLALVWVVASVGGVAATARVVGPAYAYRNGWAWVLGMIGGVAVLSAVWTAVADRWPAARRRLVAGTVVVTAALAVVTSIAQVDAGTPKADRSGQLAAVTPDVLAGLPPGDGPVIVDGRSSWGGLVLGSGLILALERRGVDARFPAQISADPDRLDDGGTARARLVISTGANVPGDLDRPDLELLAYDGVIDLATLRSRVARGDDVADRDALAVFRGAEG